MAANEFFVCGICGFISLNGEPEGNCPVCNASPKSFQKNNQAINAPQDPQNLQELEKKHIPSIKLIKECGLLPGSCQDLHIKIGEIPHPMQAEHHIKHIDIYLNKGFISRAILTPDSLNSTVSLHLKSTAQGKISVVDSCNLHGNWFQEIPLEAT